MKMSDQYEMSDEAKTLFALAATGTLDLVKKRGFNEKVGQIGVVIESLTLAASFASECLHLSPEEFAKMAGKIFVLINREPPTEH